MKSKTYFISDVHLHIFNSPEEENKKRMLFNFLKEVRQNRGVLYIVGDFFDFWFEYKYLIPRHHFKALRYLQETVEAGCEVHMLGGNHDFWLYDFFTDEIGVQIHYDPIEILIDGKRFYIAHGDGLLKDDWKYRWLKAVLRNNIFIKCFKLLNPYLAFSLAKRVSVGSRNLSEKTTEIMEKYKKQILAFGESKFLEGYDRVILGHYHLPTNYEKNGKIFMTLGDWMQYFTFGYLYDGKLSLCYWNDKSGKEANRE